MGNRTCIFCGDRFSDNILFGHPEGTCPDCKADAGAFDMEHALEKAHWGQE